MDLTTTLANKTNRAKYIAPTPEEKEKIKHEEYKSMKAVAKSRGLEITKIRKCKIVDPVNDKFFHQLTVWLEDYDMKKDRHIYLASININDQETPRLYAFVEKEISRLWADY